MFLEESHLGHVHLKVTPLTLHKLTGKDKDGLGTLLNSVKYIVYNCAPKKKISSFDTESPPSLSSMLGRRSLKTQFKSESLFSTYAT